MSNLESCNTCVHSKEPYDYGSVCWRCIFNDDIVLFPNHEPKQPETKDGENDDNEN